MLPNFAVPVAMPCAPAASFEACPGSSAVFDWSRPSPPASPEVAPERFWMPALMLETPPASEADADASECVPLASDETPVASEPAPSAAFDSWSWTVLNPT